VIDLQLLGNLRFEEISPRNDTLSSLVVIDEIAPASAAPEKAAAGSILPDWFGILASIACAIHCAAMPFVIAFLPMFGLSFLADEAFHKVMVVVCTLLALASFIPGWRRHKRWLPAGVALAGLSCISVAAFALEHTCACCAPSEETAVVGSDSSPEAAETVCNCELCKVEEANDNTDNPQLVDSADNSPVMAGLVPFVTPLGGILLVCAHLINRRFSCRCGCCPTKSAD